MFSRRSFTITMACTPLGMAASSLAAAVADDPKLEQLLESIVTKYGLPALAGGMVNVSGLQRAGVAGVRKAGARTQATLADLWHLGSDTKAMTASLVGMLVEEGKLQWEAPLAVVFPKVSALQKADLGKVTVSQLLHHTAGLPANLKWADLQAKARRVADQREAALEEAIRTRLITAPGSTYLYSNTGYVLAGLVVENLTGKSWEDVMQQRLFTPLGMRSAGFGGIGKPGKEDQPWPHLENGTPLPQNGPAVDNPPVMGPAGTVHATLEDWAKFIADHLRGARGEKALLKPATYEMLHKPGLNDYAMGWLAVSRPWAGGVALTHSGDNTMNHCVTWLAPQKGFAAIVCINRGGQSKAADEAISILLQQQQQ
jgi:CubicO group peptidase (beta-lactamase class C family)